MRLSVFAAALFATSAACETRNISLSGRPCDHGRCVAGFTCHPDTNLCMPEVDARPSDVQTGDRCDAPGAFLHCCDGDTDCRRGCRTCLDNHTWGACPGCATGILTSCANCCDDCTTLAHVDQASCTAAPACQIEKCDSGFADTDALVSTGCEVQCAPVPDLCDGLDNDCDGLVDRADSDLNAQSEIDAHCGGLHCVGCDVAAWDCAGACVIALCAPNQWDADGVAGTGCEHTCAQTPDPTERCDGLDNDCNNRVDTADPALDTQAELNAVCGDDRCSGCGVLNWMCAGSACNIMECDATHKNVDGLPGNGCECARESNTAFCLRLGKDCDNVTRADNCGDLRTANCGACSLPELCGGGGGSANVCRSWWDCAWTHRRQITVTSSVALTAPYSVHVEIDHAALVSGGLSLASGHDVRVLRRNGTTWTELPRVADPEPPYGWNRSTTRVWFATTANITAGAADSEYFLYYGYASATDPTFNESQVFHWADFFDRGELDVVGNGWRVLEATTGSQGDIDIAAGALFWANPGDYANRPVAEYAFPAITTALVWRFGFDWDEGTEGTYALFIQLGEGAGMFDPPNGDFYEFRGNGPSFAWVDNNFCSPVCNNEELVSISPATGNPRLGVISGLHDVTIVADVTTDTYAIYVDGASRGMGLAFYEARSQLDKMRCFTWNVGTALTGRRFTYALVRKYVSPEPVVSRGDVEQSDCN